MNGWDALFLTLASFILFLAAVIVFIVGFAKRGIDFVKHGFGKTVLDSSLEKRFDDLAARIATKEDIAGLRSEFRTELEAIKVNHFGRLKGFLTELTDILLDKDVINNQDKARLDNKLRGM
jgi:hypothetical protein